MRPAQAFNEQSHTGWCRVELYGDVAAARAHINHGRAQLGQMRMQNGIGAEGAGFWHMNQTLPDGTRIQTIHNSGHDTIRIVGVPRPARAPAPRQRKMRVAGKYARVTGNLMLPDQYPPGDDADRPAHWRIGAQAGSANIAPDPSAVIVGLVDYGYLWANAISDDGRLIGGGGYHQDEDFAWVYNVNTGTFTQIGSGDGLGTSQSETKDFSRDGRVVVGYSFSGVWRRENGVMRSAMGTAKNSSMPVAVSGNGRYMTWVSGGTSMAYTSTLWDAETATTLSTTIAGVAFAVSDDGTVVGNNGGSQGGTQFLGGNTFVRTLDGTVTSLGAGTATDISFDGTHICGYITSEVTDSVPWVWTEADGVVTIGDNGFCYALAKPYFLPDTSPEAPQLFNPHEVMLCGIRFSHTVVETQFTSAQEPWETNNIPEYSEVDGSVLGLRPSTNLPEPWSAYDEDDWDVEGATIPLVAVSTGEVYGTVVRNDFTQASYREAAVFYVETIPGGSPATTKENFWMPVYWDRDRVMHDLDIASASQGTALDIAIPIGEAELTLPA